LLQGHAEEVSEPSDVARLERLPLAPWSSRPKPVWLRIRAKSITGRRIPPHAGKAFEEEQ
jgi:hypothetical protein